MRTIFPMSIRGRWFSCQEVVTKGATMHLVTRGIRFLVVSAIRVLFSLSVILTRLILLPLLLATIRLTGSLIFFSFSATVNGPRQFIDRLAGEWTQSFHETVHDRSHIHEIYQLCRILVIARMVLGWVVLIAFTVAILRVVFGFFL
jgi:hypothetical protein